ncbi:MAG: hypothetical protein KF905_11980 [Flavobacteriales bacterium]|nr:hypothetical protein [Flavobacteriales bacterium]
MHPTANAQSDAWVVGSQWVDLYGAQQTGTWPVTSLPTSALPNRYNGTPALRSQLTRSDGDGNLLFFAVDGNIYDADGYLIADASGANCQECVEPGIMEMLAVPVPGTCGIFYLLASNLAVSEPGLNTQISVSILDMNRPNIYWPGRSGALVGLLDGGLTNSFPAFADWESDLFDTNPNSQSDFSALLSVPEQYDVKLSSPMIRVIDPDGDGSLYWMYFVLKDKVLAYRIDATGIHLVNTGNSGAIPTYFTPQPLGQKSYMRDADVAMDGDGRVALVMGDCHLSVFDANTGQTNGFHQLLVLRFNANTGAFINATGHNFDGSSGKPDMICSVEPTAPAPNVRPGLNGLAFINNATQVLFTGERVNATNTGWEPTIGIYDLATQTWEDLVTTLNIADPVKYVRSRLHRNRMPGSNALAVYMPYPISGTTGNVAALLDVENSGNIQFVPTLATSGLSAAHQLELPAGTSSGFLQPIFLNTQITKDDYVVNALGDFSGYCCAYYTLLDAEPGYEAAGITTWSPTNNPFGNVAEVTFASDLVIPSGAGLTINNMTIRFGPNAKLVVQRGARLIGNNSTFTAIECNTRWPGIRVEGTTNDPEQEGAGHGRLQFIGCTVEHAVTGIYGGRQLSFPPNNLYFGGWVVARNSVFRDCVNGVHFENYRRLSGSGQETPNANEFSGCQFRTTSAWRGGNPARGAHLFRVNGIMFVDCSFVNEIPELFSNPAHRGMGIQARMAGFHCLATTADPASRFENLHVGVYSSSYLPDVSYTIRGGEFVNNFKGVVDLAGRDGVIVDNSFSTLQAPSGTITQTSIGIQLFQTERYAVEKNTFTSPGNSVPSTGIWFTGPTQSDNRIYDNDFTDLNFGCVVEGRHLAEGMSQDIAPGLQLLCGQHENNQVDQLILGQTGYVRYRQGLPSGGNTTANNTFNSAVDCNTSGNNPSFHPFVLSPFGNYPLEVYYYVYQNLSSPQLRPDCIQDAQGNPISFIGEWFYKLQPVNEGVPFNREVHCADHDHVRQGPGPERIPELTQEYLLKQQELASAYAQYTGNVDKMRTGDLVGMIDHQPWHPSHTLRDSLMGNYPLSDSVMKSLIFRTEPMDEWHLTQVLLQNSPLTRWVWGYLDHVQPLSPYFLDLLRQHQNGIGLRGTLELEVVLRQQERTRLMHELLYAWAQDSVSSGKQDAFAAIYLADSLSDGYRDLFMHRLEYDPAAANNMHQYLYDRRDADLVSWGQLHTALGGDWSLADSVQVAQLMDLALDQDSKASALAWASLLEAGVWDSIPSPEPPALFKNLWQPRRTGNAPSLQEVLRVLPNPASDRIAFAYPEGMERGELQIFDGQGRLVQTLLLQGQRGLTESSVKHLVPGLYVARLSFDGLNLGAVRFTVAR